MKLFIIYSFLNHPVTFSKYSPRYPVLRRPQTLLFSEDERPRFTFFKLSIKFADFYTVLPTDNTRIPKII
jgi:hypothetical protein